MGPTGPPMNRLSQTKSWHCDAQAFARPLVESEASLMVEEAQVELAGESKLESAGAGLMASVACLICGCSANRADTPFSHH